MQWFETCGQKPKLEKHNSNIEKPKTHEDQNFVINFSKIKICDKIISELKNYL